VNRRIILHFIPKIIGSGDLTYDLTDLAGHITMTLEIMASVPQFFVLTRYVESLTSAGREKQYEGH
jgi:hypothetical protein